MQINLNSNKYNFLRENNHLQNNIVLLGFGGSYAYGTNIETSDIDIRGIALNSKEEILLGRDFEQVIDKETDTTIYSLNKIIKLLLGNNPNVLEILGIAKNHRLYENSRFIKEILELEESFLSKRCIMTFGGYAHQQLRRAENFINKNQPDKEKETKMMKTIEFVREGFKNRYSEMNQFDFYVDKALENSDKEYELFVNVNAQHYPAREFSEYTSRLSSIINDYDKLENTQRNNYAFTHNKLSKHFMHLVRLYYTLFDILENHKIITYREKEHQLLMDIRNGKYLDENQKPIPEFYDLIHSLQHKAEELSKITTLPDNPNYDKVYNWLMKVNEEIVKETYLQNTNLFMEKGVKNNFVNRI